MFFIIPQTTPGLTAGDFDFRLWFGVAPGALAPVLTELVGHGYRIDGLPEPSQVAPWTVTYEFPPGASGSFVYGGLGAPAWAIVPSREAGLALADFNAALFRNGIASGFSFAEPVELGLPGDYAFALPTPQALGASWLFIWSRGGQSSDLDWTEVSGTGIAYATYADFVSFFRQPWISEYLSGLPDSLQPAFVGLLLEQASARIDAALEAANYTVPVTPDLVSADERIKVMGLLRSMCCYLAVEGFYAGSNDLPAGPKAAIASATAWLKGLADGTIRLTGATKLAQEVQDRAAGAALFIPSGEGENFPSHLYNFARTHLW